MKILLFMYKLFFYNREKIKKIALEEEGLSLEDLKAKQLIKFKKVIEHAYENVPFYRNKFDSVGIKPSDIKSFNDIKKIPYTTKEELKKGFPEEVIAQNLKGTNFVCRKTSGSSGDPFAFYLDDNFENEEKKSFYRMQKAMGLKFGDTIVRMRSRDIPREGINGWLSKWLTNTKHISTQDMSKKNMQKYIDFIKKYKPALIESFPHHILSLADYMEKNNLTLDVRLIHLVGGNTSDNNRKKLKKIFNCELYSNYGSAECMNVAYQCEKKNNYHVEMLRFYVEIIKDGKKAKKDEIGEIVITNLDNFIMPFIRYRIKDLGVLGKKCSCGRESLVISKILGRVRQAIFLKNGKLLDPNVVNKIILNFYYAIKHFQIILEKNDLLLIKVVPTPKYTNLAEKEIIKKLEEIIGKKTKIEIKKVKDIKKYGLEKKEMLTYSQLPPDFTILTRGKK